MSTETPETAMTRDLLPEVFNQFPISMRKLGDGQVLLDVLADVLPGLVRQVRAQVAEEIEAEAATGSLNASEYGSHENVLEAARLARGEQP